VAQGEAQAIHSVYDAIQSSNPDTSLLTIKYLEALSAMADGKATKIIVPTELSGLAGGLTAITELLKSPGPGPNGGGEHDEDEDQGRGVAAVGGGAQPATVRPPVQPVPPYEEPAEG
jgi:hypothetical protein